MEKKSKLVEMAEKICEECDGYRTEKVTFVRISSVWRCPFRYTHGGTAMPERSCRHTNKSCSDRGTYKVFPVDCPLLLTPMYHDGEIIMLTGVRYKQEQRK